MAKFYAPIILVFQISKIVYKRHQMSLQSWVLVVQGQYVVQTVNANLLATMIKMIAYPKLWYSVQAHFNVHQRMKNVQVQFTALWSPTTLLTWKRSCARVHNYALGTWAVVEIHTVSPRLTILPWVQLRSLGLLTTPLLWRHVLMEDVTLMGVWLKFPALIFTR
jgi:hypothetical protein